MSRAAGEETKRPRRRGASCGGAERSALERELRALRGEIDRIDDRLLRTLERRAVVAVRIGQVKRSLGLRLHAPERERQVINRLLARNRGLLTSAALRRVFAQIVRSCLAVQRARRTPQV